jgi:ectoine hydroxylase-related dioxygenase (phytanoyl-CoA dioxygenase family)
VSVLSDDDLRTFGKDGYVVVPGVVGEDLMAAADDEIDDFIASIEPNMDGGETPDGTAPGRHGWSPPASALPRCDDALRRSGALAIAEQLVAPFTLDHRFDHIQVATTVPPYPHVPGGPHVDNHGPGDHVQESFTVLAGILLTDQDRSQTGNLWVWPGSHFGHSRLFHERGTGALRDTGGHVTMLDPPFPIGTGVEVMGRRGDLVLAHFLTGHNGGGNTADHVRRTIYYRLATPGHADRWETTFLDPLHEYEPVRAALDR